MDPDNLMADVKKPTEGLSNRALKREAKRRMRHERKEKLLVRRAEYRQAINELQVKLTDALSRRTTLSQQVMGTPASTQTINEQFVPTKTVDINQPKDSSATTTVQGTNEDALKSANREVRQIRKDIATYKKLLKDKDPDLQVFSGTKKADVAFEVRDLNLWYRNGDKQALFDINIDILKNKVTALIGPSGCGKSTFLRTLNRMNDMVEGVKTKGNVWFLGTSIFSKLLSPMELRTKVGMVFQKPTPFNLSIYENIAYALRAHGIRDREQIKQTIEQSLKGAALYDEVKDSLHESALGLSGGQQQRLCIARAIALRPDVLLMDEPTSALDPIATSKIELLIQKLREEFTIIIVTHSMAQAQRISDQTVFFYEGRIVESGTTRQIFMQPKQKRTKDYVSGRIG